MDTQESSDFDINHHRYVAQQIRSGRAHAHLVEASQEMLLAEVERLTYLISPAKGEPVEAYNLGPIIAALAKQPPNASVVVEHLGSKQPPEPAGFHSQTCSMTR
ncbi:MAG: hypothetical protein M3017_01260 [Actinomycetota bacterium]|nr:hypothetical protein [Actinomycetota bacterium]